MNKRKYISELKIAHIEHGRLEAADYCNTEYNVQLPAYSGEKVDGDIHPVQKGMLISVFLHSMQKYG